VFSHLSYLLFVVISFLYDVSSGLPQGSKLNPLGKGVFFEVSIFFQYFWGPTGWSLANISKQIEIKSQDIFT
jgi:hypothetical protein